jgi:hypothetical protein
MIKAPFRIGLSGILFVSGLLFASVVLAAIVVGSSTTNISNDVVYTQLKLTQPSNTAVGDFLLANVCVKGGSGATITAPPGWTLIGRTDNDDNVTIASYWVVATTTGSVWDIWTITPSTRAVGGITRFTGIDSNSPVDAMASSTGRGTYATTTAVTTARSGDQIITIYATSFGRDSSINFATSTGMTKEYDAQNTPYGPTTSFQDLAQTATGTTATASSTFTTGPQREWATQTIALEAPLNTITLDNQGSGAAAATSVTISYTAAANSLITVCGENDIDVNGSNFTATWNGATMTKDVELHAVGGPDDHVVKTLFSYYETMGGTHNIVVTATGQSTYVEANVASFLGAKNAHAFATTTTYTGANVTSAGDTIDTTGHNNALHIACGYIGTSPTASTGAQIINTKDNNRTLWASSPYTVTPAGSNTITVTWPSATGAAFLGGAYDIAP